MALGSPAAARLFPHPEIQLGWIAWDALLFAGLVALARRWRRRLAAALAAAAALDAACGLLQVLAWTGARARGLDWLAIAVAIAAPIAASVFLTAAARQTNSENYS